jgi:metal-sulfur cluster biosynthetic enzyme
MTEATAVTVNLVWEPAWTPELISPAGRQHLQLN